MTNSKRGEKQQLPKTVLTTPQVAAEIGVAESTVRSWLSRHTCFVEGYHYIKEDSGRTLWLEEGVNFLKSRSGEFSEPEPDTVTFSDDVIDPLIEATAQALAYRYLEKLPSRTVQRIKQILSNPTEQDKEVLQRAVQQSINDGAFVLITNSTAKRLPV